MADHKPLVPYENCRFQVSWDGKIVAGVNKVGALTRTSQLASWREGADPSAPHSSPGQVDYQPITLEQGLTEDTAFEQWANKVWDYPSSSQLGQEVSLRDFRRDITITLLDLAGREVMAWIVYRCWVSDYSATPDLDANNNAVAIRSMTLQNEGWSRIPAVHAPDNPGFDDAPS